MLSRFHINKYVSAKLCTSTKSTRSQYSDTVLLPKTKLTLRLEGKKLVDRDRLLSSSFQFLELYKWQRNHLSGNEFILHDGPPYANGVPHMGHAINKVLKDVILRTKILQGNKVHYIPGWDCHGLPIELKAILSDKESDFIKIRSKARNFATESLEEQKAAFISWGVIGDWANAYTTYDPKYMKNQIIQFFQLYSKKLVYRDIKPVYWSPSTKTALAEAELEYNSNHTSTAVILKLKLQSFPCKSNNKIPIYGLVWTTTPWTLPSNQAVCYNPELSYSVVQNNEKNECYIVATNLVKEISNKLNTELEIIESFQGNVLKDTIYIHPLYKSRTLKFLSASHALETKGTGLVHTAPAHGAEDYLVALQNNININCMVDENGRYTSQAGSDLDGLFVLSDGTKSVLSLLGNDVVHVESFVHSYPYDWRTKKPVILRASKQWFVDTNTIKQRAFELLENIKIMPESRSEVYRHHFRTQLLKRPYWCISRQRSWGVPIPVFYFKDSDDVIINEDTIKIICDHIDKNTSDFWWKLEEKDILQKSFFNKYGINPNNVKKGEDILDIWFDSGLSWSSVLPDKQIADLYLEGVDQFTGWFQSSLLTSTALRNKAPYKTVYVHGFAVDQNGMKMSKSLGNVINPKDIVEGTKKSKAYGVDTLRWWVACHANEDAITEVSTTVLQATSDEVQKVRSVLRFAVAALNDYENTIIDYSDLKLIDKYMLHLISRYQRQTEEYLNSFHFHKVNIYLIQFLTNSVSALYYTSIKDRLYCDPQNSLNRKSVQYILNIILNIVTRSIAPIVPHLAEELHTHLTFKNVDSFFKTTKLEISEQWYSETVQELMEYILNFKKEVNKQISANTLNKDVLININSKLHQKFKQYTKEDSLCSELSDVFQVANVQIIEDDSLNNVDYKIKIANSSQHNCPRCRKFLSSNDNELCYRCNIVTGAVKITVGNL